MADSCKLSAVTLALRSLTNNEELTRRLADLAEESNVAYLYSDALKEGAITGVEGEGKLINEYTLKKESADIKFKSVLFGGLLANTRQGDEALDMLTKEIAQTGGTAAEGLGLIELMSRMDLQGLDDAAKVVFNTTKEEANKIVADIRNKIANYVGSDYSIVRSGSNVKANEVIKKMNKELDDAVEKLAKAKDTLGQDAYNDVDKDLKRLNSTPKGNSKYWSTKAGRDEVRKLADKYGTATNKSSLEKYLKSISDAKKVVKEQENRIEEMSEEYVDALEGDLKLIENGQNPFNYVGADAEWKFIKEFDDSVSTRVQQYGQYALARTLLTDNGNIPQSIYDMLVKTIRAETKGGITNYIGEPLTEDWILSKDRTLEELLSRAYMNTQQLVSDGNLRRIYRQQLRALASDDILKHSDVEFIENLINTMKFAEKGAGFSTVLKYNALVNWAKEIGVDIGGRNGRDIWNGIVDLLKDDAFETLITRGDTVVLKDGLQLTKRQLLELITNMAGDINLKKAVALNQWTDSDLIGVVSKYLLGDNVEGAKRLKSLIGKAKETPTTDDIRGVILRTITGKNVPKDTKVAFFDFRKGLNAEDDVKERAKYMESLANANKVNIPNNTIENITTNSTSKLAKQLEKLKGGYILVNDSQWKMSKTLSDALDEVNYKDGKLLPEEERVKVIFPKGGLMGQIKSEGDNLVFKSMYSDRFNDMLETIALRTFGQSGADSKFSQELLEKLSKGDLDAIAEMNRTLEDDAKEYYAAMLGVDKYDDRLVPMLEEMTGISFKNYDAIVDKADFWKRVDDTFMLEGKVLGTYSQEVTTVSNVIKEVDVMTPDQIAKDLSYRFGYTIKDSEIIEDGVIRADIKQAYLNYKLAQTPLELLERKGKLIATINGGTADNITTNQFRSMMQSGNFDAYKDIFFHNADFDENQLRLMTRKINDMIFDNLGAEIADRLVEMGYSLPLMNIRELVFDWAMGTLDVNNGFVSAFFAKNGLSPTMSTLNGILNQVIPTDLKFAYDDAVESLAEKSVKGNIYKGAKTVSESVPDYTKRLIEEPNEFIQDTYSSLVSMAVVRNGAILPGTGNERRILEGMLNEYYKAYESALKDGDISFKEAQKLKTKMGYALDMFEQDYLGPRYGKFLNPTERSELFGLKYTLGVTTNKSGLKTIKEYNERILNRYTDATDRVIRRANAAIASLPNTSKSIKEEVQKRQQELINQGATAKVVNGQIVVVDIRNEIVKQLNSIPSSISGLEGLKTLGKTGLNQLSNQEAFFILNLIELAKNADNQMNLIMKTIYKVSPQLAKVDFFNLFKSVNGLPKALAGNLLIGSKKLSKYENLGGFDKKVKEGIFGDIKNAFRANGQITYDELTKIIKDNIDINVDMLGGTVKKSDLPSFKKEAALIYQGAFNLYTALKDVPKGVKDEIDNILKDQRQGIMSALNMLGDNNRLVDIMDSISIVTADGSVKSFSKILEGEENSLSKILFDETSDIIKEADEAAMVTEDVSRTESKRSKVRRENEITVEKTTNNYLDGLQAVLNEAEVISQAERDLINTTRTSARQIAKQYTLTNKLAETDNALVSINEEIMRDFKSGVLGFLGQMTQGGQNVRWGKNITDDVMRKRNVVKERYRTLYNLSYDQLMKYQGKDALDGLAKNMAMYFKEIERRLGSLDGMAGATTSRDINMAFAHLGEVVLNIDSISSLFSLMSGVEGNQLLKFFRFANPGEAARVDELIIGGVGKQYLGGYRNFVDKTDEGLNVAWFNKTFASNLSNKEYTKLIQALCGFTVTSKKYKWLEKALNYVNQSNYLFRTLVSYPGQLLTVHPQSIAYWLRQIGHEKDLGAEDLYTIDGIRSRTGILNTTYNEFNIFRYASPDDVDPTSFYNRYGIPDVDDLMKDQRMYTSDDLETMYSRIDDYGSGKEGGLLSNIRSPEWRAEKFNKFLRNTDAYKDNANNIIDGAFARNFKNIAFVKALQSNDYMKFATATQFAEFMSGEAPEYMKRKLMDAVAEASGRNFRNILGLGFSGLDRAIGGSAIRNAAIGLMQMFNFRGAWGQNIARQTWNWLATSIKMAKSGLSKEGKDALALYIAKQPEFVNFSSQLFTDLRNSWLLVKYQDNGDWTAEDDDLSIIDFIQYAYETLQFSSQWWQGIQSYGTTRILSESIESMLQTAKDPEIYKDTYGIGALMNAMSKNLGRNWKVPNLVVKVLGQPGGASNKWAVLQNEFWKLSFGSLRYLMNEDETSYGYNTELIKNRPGAIPFLITGEVSEDGDKAFSYDIANTETWLNVQNRWRALGEGDGSTARTYLMNNLDSFFNASQMLGTLKNVGRTIASSSLVGDKIKGWLADDLRVYQLGSPFDLAEIGDAVDGTEAGHEFMLNGYYRPTEAKDVKILLDEVMKQADYRPGNNGFNKSMFNFDKSGHMASLEGSNSRDASMEMLLSNIKYERDDNFRFITDSKGEKVVRKEWTAHMNDMLRRANDTSYMTYSNFNFINNWIEDNNDDPNYMLYKRLIGEGLAGRYASQVIDDLIDEHNKVHGYKKDKRMTQTKLKDSGLYDVVYPQIMAQQTTVTGEKTDFLTAIMALDKEATMSANIKMIERQLALKGEDEQIKKLFKINKDGEISLSNKYKSYLEEQAKLSQALNEGDIDKFKAETASITRLFRDADPYGIATTVLIASRINRINDADSLSAEQKAKAIDALMEDNYDFIQTHIPEFIDAIGNKEEAMAYASQMNESIYNTSYIGDKLVADNEMANSKSGRAAAVRVSTKAKNLLGKLGAAAGGGSTSGAVGGGKKYNYNFVPVRLDGAKLLKMTGGKGYTPVTSSAAIKTYKAHADFSAPKDINRKIKTTKTQTVSNKKQLSNIETKTKKATEAES